VDLLIDLNCLLDEKSEKANDLRLHALLLSRIALCFLAPFPSCVLQSLRNCMHINFVISGLLIVNNYRIWALGDDEQ
jgi:hypothetical protein